MTIPGLLWTCPPTWENLGEPVTQRRSGVPNSEIAGHLRHRRPPDSGQISDRTDAVLQTLRRISIAEAISYLVLLAATVVKRLEWTDIGVTVVGPIHGMLFLAYAAMILLNMQSLGWNLVKALGALVIGSLPFGGFWVEREWLAPLA